MLHTLVVYVEDKPGVLNRVASLFRRRAFNIDSLTVGHTETPGVSRMTIVCDADPAAARRVEANIYKLVDVLRVDDITDQPSVERELAMIKVTATHETRAQIIQLADVFRARTVDVSHDSLIVEITGSGDKVERLLEVLQPYGVLEMVRTGRVAMARGPRPAEKLEDRFAGEDAHEESGVRSHLQSSIRNRQSSIPMATIYYDKDADLSLIQSKNVAIIGYGSQGHAHALNLKDSGVNVAVGLAEGSKSAAKAKAAGLEVKTVAEAAKWADVIMILVPDTTAPKLYRESIAPHLTAGKTLMFAHGFNIRYGTITPPKDVDVSMIAPKSPGHRVRELFVEGGGTPALVAVEQDASGTALAQALAYGKGIGTTRAGVLVTTFTEETETDLFGEQAVLCGGVSELVKAGFKTLVDAGYQPEVAYFECLHELKLIVDLMYRGGLNYMRYSVSDTAEYGDYTAGPRVIGEAARAEMQKLLAEIQDGTFAKKWVKENEDGRPWFQPHRAAEQTQILEEVGAKLRALMPFIQPVTVRPDGQGA